jgi:hypothetical protein
LSKSDEVKNHQKAAEMYQKFIEMAEKTRMYQKYIPYATEMMEKALQACENR